METIIQLGLLIIGFVLLVKGADFFVDGAASIATKFGISHLIIGLTIIAMGTSAPEAAVSIAAAAQGSAAISIGNVIGSNIINILIILGITAVIMPLPIDDDSRKMGIPFVILVSILLLVLGLDGEINFSNALILFVVFLIYIGYLIWEALKTEDPLAGDNLDDGINEGMGMGKAVLCVLFGMAMVIIGSDVAVDAASELAAMLGMSKRLIGLTVVAFGTSLPELVTSITAARKGSTAMAVGNIIGSNVFNVLFVIGLSGLILPIPFEANFIIDAIVAIAAAVILLACSLHWRHTIGRKTGILMLAVYALYFAYILIH
ncbi:MAG: calcium/sodium antiporter [Firmicutes bacterium]|nr:calcium/sodium antiporter [Bacillota bacterium]